MRKSVLAVSVLLLCSLSFAERQEPTRPSQNGNAVTQWNAIALQVLSSDPGLVLDSRAYAIMHAAI